MKDSAMFVRIEQKKLKVLRKIAKRHGVTMSHLIRWGIDQVIEQDKQAS